MFRTPAADKHLVQPAERLLGLAFTATPLGGGTRYWHPGTSFAFTLHDSERSEDAPALQGNSSSELQLMCTVHV